VSSSAANNTVTFLAGYMNNSRVHIKTVENEIKLRFFDLEETTDNRQLELTDLQIDL
jgi:hypothetical protein